MNFLQSECEIKLDTGNLFHKEVYSSFSDLDDLFVESLAFMTGYRNKLIEKEFTKGKLGHIDIDSNLVKIFLTKNKYYKESTLSSYETNRRTFNSFGVPALMIVNKNLPYEVAIVLKEFLKESKNVNSDFYNPLFVGQDFNHINLSKYSKSPKRVIKLLVLLSTLMLSFVLGFLVYLLKNFESISKLKLDNQELRNQINELKMLPKDENSKKYEDILKENKELRNQINELSILSKDQNSEKYEDILKKNKELKDKSAIKDKEIELLKSKTKESNGKELYKKIIEKNDQLEILRKEQNKLENKHQQLKLKQPSSLEIGKDDENKYYFVLNLPKNGVYNFKYNRNVPENLYKFLFTYAIAKLFDMRVKMPTIKEDIHNYSHPEFNTIILTNLNKKIGEDNTLKADKIEKEDLLINISSVKGKYHWILKINEIQIKNFNQIKKKNKNLYKYLNSHFEENLFES